MISRSSAMRASMVLADHFATLKFSKVLPYPFTEHGAIAGSARAGCWRC